MWNGTVDHTLLSMRAGPTVTSGRCYKNSRCLRLRPSYILIKYCSDNLPLGFLLLSCFDASPCRMLFWAELMSCSQCICIIKPTNYKAPNGRQCWMVWGHWINLYFGQAGHIAWHPGMDPRSELSSVACGILPFPPALPLQHWLVWAVKATQSSYPGHHSEW